MSESPARPPRAREGQDPYDPYREPIAGSGEHVARTGRADASVTEVTHDPLDTSLPYEPGLSGFGGTGRDPGPLEAAGPGSATGPADPGRSSGSHRSAGSSPGAGQEAKEQASRVAQDAKESGTHVKDVATDRAADVVQEAKSQAEGLVETTRSQVSQQASQQTRRAAAGLSSLGDELQSLLAGDPQEGPATDLVRQAADRVSGAARWMEGREPADLLADVQSFARRRPGTFLAVAAGVGLVAGRLTRGVAADAKDQHDADAPGRRATPAARPSAPSPADASGDGHRRSAGDPDVTW